MAELATWERWERWDMGEMGEVRHGRWVRWEMAEMVELPTYNRMGEMAAWQRLMLPGKGSEWLWVAVLRWHTSAQCCQGKEQWEWRFAGATVSRGIYY